MTDRRKKLLAAIECAKQEEDRTISAREKAHDAYMAARWRRHEAELALRRFDYPGIDGAPTQARKVSRS